MRDPNEPSIHDHGAPYNEDDEGNCECTSCKLAARRIAKAERAEYVSGELNKRGGN